jgi:hypothetical protein
MSAKSVSEPEASPAERAHLVRNTAGCARQRRVFLLDPEFDVETDLGPDTEPTDAELAAIERLLGEDLAAFLAVPQ